MSSASGPQDHQLRDRGSGGSTICFVVLRTTNVTTLVNLESNFLNAKLAMCFHIVNFVKPQKA